MKRGITIFLFFFTTHILAQERVNQLEVTSYVRQDWYPEFSYAVNSINTKYVNIKGTSWGINAAYKISLPKSFFIKLGGGYYKYSFSKMNNYSRLGKNATRHIEYPSILDIPYLTDRYWYHCVAINLGAEKTFILNKHWQGTGGISMNNYFTFSQGYHLTYNNPNHPVPDPYKQKKKTFFGLSFTLNAGVTKQSGRFRYGPSLIIPVFDQWKQDQVFPHENYSLTRHKWSRGVGLGISCNYLLIGRN